MTMMTAATATMAPVTTETPAERAPTQELKTREEPQRRARGALARLSGLRVRILGGYILVLAVATLASLFVLRTILINRLDERINANLAQELAELQSLARGSDPDTGRPFNGNVRAIFDTFSAAEHCVV